jgi:PIN domain nuclease of toxin-antitoxin system
MKISLPLEELVGGQQRVNSIEILAITLEHILALERLPPLHKDPFDRLLIAQARTEGATLISKDPAFAGYPVKVVW